MDNQSGIASGKNYYSTNGGATWDEHYAFWNVPGDVGYNMIRATVNDAPPPDPTADWQTWLPRAAKNWSLPTETPPIPPQDDIPCLVVIERLNSQWDYNILAGCAGSTGGPRSIAWRFDGQGAVVGFDLTIEDGQGGMAYEASIDIQRSGVGQITSYGGTVSGDSFTTFTQSIVNTYDPGHGGFVEADVTKVYAGSGAHYTMQITDICVAGYRVKVFEAPYNGQEVVVGSCS
jgi:hypothetical protein